MSTNFKKQLDIRSYSSDGILWQLLDDYSYELEPYGSSKVITVPKFTLTDGASIPKLLWNIMPPWADYSRAAIIHDYLYLRLALNNPHELCLTKQDADKIFYEAMLVSGVSKVKSKLIYNAVKYFGVPAVSYHQKGSQ